MKSLGAYMPPPPLTCMVECMYWGDAEFTRASFQGAIIQYTTPKLTAAANTETAYYTDCMGTSDHIPNHPKQQKNKTPTTIWVNLPSVISFSRSHKSVCQSVDCSLPV